MIRNWNDFDSMLRDVALIDVSVAKAAATRNQTMIEAETTYNTAAAPLLAKRLALGAELELFYKAHRKEVEATGLRTKELIFGRAGMRKGNPTLSCLKGWKWDKVLEAIQRRFARNTERLEQFVITKTSINKDGVKSAGFSDEELATIGCKVKQADEFWYETFPEKAQERAA